MHGSGTRQFFSNGKYTGYNLHQTSGSRTAQNENVINGSVVQLDACNHGSATDGYEFGVPTAGFRGPLAIVAGMSDADLSTVAGAINYQDGAVANKRAGGILDLRVVGQARARVKANCVRGVTLLGPVDGQMYLGPWQPDGELAAMVTDSTAVTNTVSTEQTFTGASAVIPALTARIGDIYKFRVVVAITATAGTDTLTVKLKIGSNIILVSGAADAATSDIVVIEGWLLVRTIGASGTFVSGGLTFNGTPAAAASAADIPSGTRLGSTTNDFTADTTITVTGTWSATSATCTANVELFSVSKESKAGNQIGPDGGAYAIAMATVDNSAVTTAASQVTDILIVQNCPY